MILKNMTQTNDGQNGSKKFFVLFILGFFIVLVGIIILIAAAMLYSDGSVNFGGFILIGPFPIVIGAGQQAPLMAVFAIILGVISIIMFLVLRRRIE